MATSVKKTLSDDTKKARMINWLSTLKMDTNKVKGLIEKYGVDYSYRLLYDSMMKPYELSKKIGASQLNSAKMVDYLLKTDISPDKLGKALNISVEEVSQNLQTNKKETPVTTAPPANNLVTNNQVANNQEQQVSSYGRFFGKISDKQTLNDKIDYDFAQMKGDKNGEFSFADLEKMGITPEEVSKYITPEDIAQIHTSSTSSKLAYNAKKYERNMSGSGRCLAGVQLSVRDTLGTQQYKEYPKVEKLKGSTSNSACYSDQAWEQLDFVVLRMQNDTKNGNPCLKNVCAGGIVNFDRGQTKHGHVCVSGGNGYYYCDIKQSSSSIASGKRIDGARYGDFCISYPKDCTLSDELVKKILKERELEKLGIKEKDLPDVAPWSAYIHDVTNMARQGGR